jgi:hypothetical protein
MVRFARTSEAQFALSAPVAPGVVETLGVGDWRRMPARVPFAPSLKSGTIALDGEREIFFSERDEVSMTLIDNAFQTVDVAATMRFAAIEGLFRHSPQMQLLSLA